VIETPDSPLASILGGAVASAVGSLFAAADGALVSIPEPRLQALADDSAHAASFGRYKSDRRRVLSRWLVCRVIATSLAAALYGRAAETLTSSPALTLTCAVFGAVVTYGALAEILLSLGRRRPEPAAAFALRFLRPLEYVVAVIAEPLAMLGRAIAHRVAPKRPTQITESELEWVVSEGERAGALGNEPAEMIRNVLEFKDQKAVEIMVPRRRVSGIEVTTSLEKTLEIVAAEGHSRYPVFRETLDNIVGLLYAKDLFAVVQEKRLGATTLADIARAPVLFVVETQPILSILREMRAGRLHMAVVTDEFGGTSGVVTMEDIIEEIVGEIRDEYDSEADAQIQDMGDGRLVADAAVPLADLSAKLGRDIPADGAFESLGGLLVSRAGKVPEVGATLTVDGVHFIVREADETRVVKVEIVAQPSMSPPPPS